MKFTIFLVFLLIISGCSSLGGLAEEGSKSQQEFEGKLKNTYIQNKSLNSSPIKNALIESITALNKLQDELIYLEKEIDSINKNLENISSGEVDSQTILYLNELNSLTEKSKKFVSSFYDSTKIWDTYLSNQSYDPRKLKEINSTKFSDSIQEPLKAWTN